MIVPGPHPFAVEAHFDKSLVLAFALPREHLAALLPDCLELDLFEEQWGFVAVAMVKTRALRPKGLPAILGRDFTLVGYRIFVRYRGADGRRLRGLYILGSRTDRRSMVWLGNFFTRYRYAFSKIDWATETHADGDVERVSSAEGLEVVAMRPLEGTENAVPLPDCSPFADWKQARQFAGPMPFTFSVDSETRSIVIVEGVRSSWRPVPMRVERWNAPFFSGEEFGMDFSEAVLANAFLVEDVPYHWKRGRREFWGEGHAT